MNERERSLRREMEQLNREQSTGSKPPELYPETQAERQKHIDESPLIEDIDLILWHRIGESLRDRFTGRPWADMEARRGGEIIVLLVDEIRRLREATGGRS